MTTNVRSSISSLIGYASCRYLTIRNILHLHISSYYWIRVSLFIIYSNIGKGENQWFILEAVPGWKRATLSGAVSTSSWHFADVNLRCHSVRQCNVVFSRVNNVRNACKHQRYRQHYWWGFFMRWHKVTRIWRIQLLFVVLYVLEPK